jgi:hypothetical protein
VRECVFIVAVVLLEIFGNHGDEWVFEKFGRKKINRRGVYTVLITSDESPTNGGRYWIRPRDCCRTVIYQITCRAVCGGNDSLTGVFVATFLRVTNDVQKWVLPTTNRTILFLCDKSYSGNVCAALLDTIYAFHYESKNFDGVYIAKLCLWHEPI